MLSAACALAVAGCGSADQSQQKLAAANQKAAKIVAAAKAKAAKETRDAASELASAQSRVAAEESRLLGEQRKVRAASSRLSRLQAQINGVEHAVAKDTIPGDGTFLVGKDAEHGDL